MQGLYQYKHLVDQTGGAGKCVLREEVTYQETGKAFYVSWTALMWSHNI